MTFGPIIDEQWWQHHQTLQMCRFDQDTPHTKFEINPSRNVAIKAHERDK